jgi:hypothetical protein
MLHLQNKNLIDSVEKTDESYVCRILLLISIDLARIVKGLNRAIQSFSIL